MEVPLDQKIKMMVGEYKWDYGYVEQDVSIAGKIYSDYGTVSKRSKIITFDIQGWENFTANIGFDDAARWDSGVSLPRRNALSFASSTEIAYGNQVIQGSITIRRNNEEFKKIRIKQGDKAVLLSVPLNGYDTLSFEYTGDTYYIILATPRLSKGGTPSIVDGRTPPPGVFVCLKCNIPFASQQLLDQHNDVEHRIMVDPRDIKSLAAALRKRVEGKPAVLELVTKGHVALATFNRIAIYSPATATDIAENLSGELINLDFPLVERGQLDALMKELKIQNTGMIDPKTAKKIGETLGCDLIIVGSISDQGQFVVINCRLLETATGKALAAEQVEGRKNIVDTTK